MLQGLGFLFLLLMQLQSNEQKRMSNCKENNQNWTIIYVLLFKAMAIMANCYFFIHMNVKEFKPKIHLM
jgi:hypothetical protein